MSVFKNALSFDDFAEDVVSVKEDWETDIWSYGLPGLIALIRAFVKDGYTDRSRLVDAIRSLSEVFDCFFIDEFIGHLTGHHPDIHVLYEDNEGKLGLIENANL